MVEGHCGNPVWKHLLQEKLVLHCSWQVTARAPDADVWAALLHCLRKTKRNVKLTSLMPPLLRPTLVLIGKVARRYELGTTEE